MADALLWKAGLLHSKRVGDQDKGRSLDTLKDEKERGITIKSAAITLDSLMVRESVLPYRETSTPTKEADDDHQTIEFYIGNLPKGMDDMEGLLDLLAKEGIVMDRSAVSIFNSRRAYAIIKVKKRLTSSLMALNGSVRKNSATGLVVQVAGETPMHRLKEICQEQRISMPSFSVKKQELERDSYKASYIASATWPALGGVIISAPEEYTSEKQARQEVARACLNFLYLQENDHVITPGKEDVVSDFEQSLTSTGEQRSDPPVTDETGERMAPLVVNLIDTPGHVEFNAEVTASLRLSDGALVVVDAIEGKAAQTDEVLIQALREGVKPVLMLNKVDRLFIDKQYDAAEAYDRMQQVVDDINVFIANHQLKEFPDQQVSFMEGSVCFGSGYFGWSCSIDTFVMNEKDPAKQRAARDYLSKRENFIKHVIKPILKMHRICGVLPMKKKCDSETYRVTMVNELLSAKLPKWTGRRLMDSDEDAETISPRMLLKRAMMAWLPAADAILDMIAAHVPSPAAAQRMRASLLYEGDIKDDAGQGILRCDPDGPIVIYISKMSPSDQSGKRLLAFGRVYSGTVRPGDSLRAIRTDGSEHKAKVSQIKLCGIERRMSAVHSAHAGQLIALEGIDGALNKAGTLTSSLEGKAIRHMDFAVTPIVQHSVRPRDKKDLVRMIAAFRSIANADSSAIFFKDDETKEYILAGVGELHIEVLVSSLLQSSGIQIELSEPIIAYRETIQSASSDVALAKSSNKHNRLWVKASPLDVSVVDAMISGELVGLDCKALGEALMKRFGWTSTQAARIWALGPESPSLSNEDSNDIMNRPTCLLVDSTFGLQIPDDARANIIAAFLQVVRQGPVVHAPMRGVCFEIVDARFHGDAVHRRPNQVVPASARALNGAFLLANPKLMEPIYAVNITGTGHGSLRNAFSVLGQCGGNIVDTTSTLMSETILASVPVRRSFGLAKKLRLATHGRCLVSYRFDGMRLVAESDHCSIVALARLRKKLDDQVPEPDVYIDKL